MLELTDYLHLWAVVVDIHLGNEPDKTIGIGRQMDATPPNQHTT